MKRTGWYSGHQKPARPGVYERLHFGYTEYSLWAGGLWWAGMSTPSRAERESTASPYQSLPWRGLTEEHK